MLLRQHDRAGDSNDAPHDGGDDVLHLRSRGHDDGSDARHDVHEDVLLLLRLLLLRPEF